MRDILNDIQPWLNAGEPFALATVINTWGSSPRGAGATMAVRHDLAVCGSVSGGCVENAVIDEALATLETGAPSLLTFGVEDETAWSVGLSCGGSITIFVEPHISLRSEPEEQAIWKTLSANLHARTPVIILTRLTDAKHLLIIPHSTLEGVNRAQSVIGDWGEMTEPSVQAALQAYTARASKQIDIAGTPVFIHVIPKPAQLLIIGAAHIAVSLVKFARELEFETTVIDPRGVFADIERFSGGQPHHLVNLYPDEILPTLDLSVDTFALTLAHDPKIDDEALKILLRSNVRYIGALGSKKTHTKRCERLRTAGFGDREISRIHAPIGLDIHAETPAEIALSIIAEITTVRRGKNRE